MEYTNLEKKVIARGKRNFRDELEKASKPMIEVLSKYGIRHGHPLLKAITLSYPYSRDEFSQCAVSIPDDKGLEIIENVILDNWIKEVEEIKGRIESLEFEM